MIRVISQPGIRPDSLFTTVFHTFDFTHRARNRSIAELLRYFHSLGLGASPSRRQAFAQLWQEAISELRVESEGEVANFGLILEHAANLAKKPARVSAG